MSEFLTYANGKGAVSDEKYAAPRLKQPGQETERKERARPEEEQLMLKRLEERHRELLLWLMNLELRLPPYREPA